MKLGLALGIALAALTVAAAAQTSTHVVVRHGGGHDVNVDANNDGWITREEAAAAADAIFADLDHDRDGRLTAADRPEQEAFEMRFEAPDIDVEEGEDGERHVRVIVRGDDVDVEEIEEEVERAVRDAERQVRRAERHARDAERHAERAARDAERHVERNVVVVYRGEWTDEDGEVHPVPPVAPVAPLPPMPPRPPMFMMLIANSEEADLDGDGAISREEFRAQHLRFFDASDANGDGRVRFDPPPAPPEPPAPPAPPEPPR